MSRKGEMRTLTEQQAYRAMLEFLDRHFEKTGSDDIAALLGSASLLDDGGSADPAMRSEWPACIEAVLAADAGKEAAEGNHRKGWT